MNLLRRRKSTADTRKRSPRVPAGTRVYAIGDVHGEGLLLQSLLSVIHDDLRQRPALRVELVFLGDIIDRGPHSATLARALYQARGKGLTVLRGNHEDALVSSYNGDDRALKFWMNFGGRETLASFGIDAEDAEPDAIRSRMHAAIESELVDWLAQSPTSYSIGDYFFAHAGVRPGVDLDAQDDEDLMWIREPFLESDADHGQVIVHGHTITSDVALNGNRISLDTGAHEHRKLTALGLEGGDQWVLQVSGRNLRSAD